MSSNWRIRKRPQLAPFELSEASLNEFKKPFGSANKKRHPQVSNVNAQPDIDTNSSCLPTNDKQHPNSTDSKKGE